MYFLIVSGMQIMMFVVSIEPTILEEKKKRKNIGWKNTLTKDLILARNLYHRDITVAEVFMMEFPTTFAYQKRCR